MRVFLASIFWLRICGFLFLLLSFFRRSLSSINSQLVPKLGSQTTGRMRVFLASFFCVRICGFLFLLLSFFRSGLSFIDSQLLPKSMRHSTRSVWVDSFLVRVKLTHGWKQLGLNHFAKVWATHGLELRQERGIIVTYKTVLIILCNRNNIWHTCFNWNDSLQRFSSAEVIKLVDWMGFRYFIIDRLSSSLVSFLSSSCSWRRTLRWAARSGCDWRLTLGCTNSLVIGPNSVLLLELLLFPGAILANKWLLDSLHDRSQSDLGLFKVSDFTLSNISIFYHRYSPAHLKIPENFFLDVIIKLIRVSFFLLLNCLLDTRGFFLAS
jgi:hypothetical protein